MRNSSAATTTKTAPLASPQRFVFMGSSACSASASDDVEVLESLRDVPVLRFLGVQLDVQPQVVHAVGVRQRVMYANLARLEQVEQRLIEGLHAELARLLHDFLDLVHLALEDQVGNERGVEHDLDRGAATFAFLQGDEALRNEPPQIERQVHQQLLAPLLGEEVDDAIQRLIGAVRVQRCKAQVAGLGEGHRVIHGLPVADLADQDDVGRLAQGGLERGLPVHGVHADFALGNEAALVRVGELDRVLDGDDVAVGVLVAVADHRRERGGLARTRGPYHDHQAALGHDHVLQYVREPEVLDPGNGGGDPPQHDTDVRLLDERIDAEPPYARGVDREVAFLARFELGSLPVVHDRAGEVDGVRGCERLVRDGRHLAVDLDRRGKADRKSTRLN